MGSYDEIISLLNSNDYYKLKSDIMHLVNNAEFMEKIVKVHNPIVFDRFIKMCEFKIDTLKIHEERNKFIKKSIDKLNSNNIYEFFEIEGLEESRKKTIASRYLTEYLISYYFQDSFYNFLVNFNQMASYLRVCEKSLVSHDNIDLYKEFLNLSETTMEDKIKLFNYHLNDDLMGLFYDDLTRVREDSHKSLVDKTLKLNKENGIYQKSLSNKYGVDVYYLNGEKFYGFVRCITIKDNADNTDFIYSRGRRLGYSFSYFSSYNLGTIGYDDKTVLLYYDSIDYKNIMYVHHADMSTGKMYEQNRYLSEKENEIFTPDGLIGYTKNYNEVYIKPSVDGIKPTALICYDEIKDEDISFAKQYNLSILIINTQKYNRYSYFNDDYDSYTYVL